MTLLLIALKSARFRRTSIVLTVLAIAISATLLLGVDKIRKESRASFFNTVAGTDLIVGARSSPTKRGVRWAELPNQNGYLVAEAQKAKHFGFRGYVQSAWLGVSRRCKTC